MSTSSPNAESSHAVRQQPSSSHQLRKRSRLQTQTEPGPPVATLEISLLIPIQNSGKVPLDLQLVPVPVAEQHTVESSRVLQVRAQCESALSDASGSLNTSSTRQKVRDAEHRSSASSFHVSYKNTPPRDQVLHKNSAASHLVSSESCSKGTNTTKNPSIEDGITGAVRFQIDRSFEQLLQSKNIVSVRRYASVRLLQCFSSSPTAAYWPEYRLKCDGIVEDMVQHFQYHLKSTKSIALAPIMGSKCQLVFFERQGTMFARLLPKFHLVLDIDDTLISTRVPKTKDELPGSDEHNLFIPVRLKTKDQTYVDGRIRFIVKKRHPGVDSMLLWASQLFNISFITNGAFVYAKEALQFLDPKRQHILKYVRNHESLREILKSREDLAAGHTPQPKQPNTTHMKKLQHFNLPVRASVILDDDQTVWDASNHSNLLPFELINKAQDKRDYLDRVAECVWNHLLVLSSTPSPREVAASSTL